MIDANLILSLTLLLRATRTARAGAATLIGGAVRLPYRAWLLQRLAGPSPIAWAIGPGLRVIGLILGLPITTSLVVR